ncbi:myb-like protein Q [Anopheles nili]|uniref:myb-like protein Q n=1 Tax=Anopheles nili TaxID=185578 RepID=UPI00237A6689|nr:myb-like protein Q [Anopheles nili]
MGDAKVKPQPFFGTPSHHHHHSTHINASHELPSGTTSKATPSAPMASAVMEPKHATSGLIGSGSAQQSTKEAMAVTAGGLTAGCITVKDKNSSSLKYEQLKLRKQELEKRLNEKYSQLQQVKREEAQLIGMYPSDFSCGIGPSNSSDGLNGTSGSVGGSASSNGIAPTLRRKIGTSFKLPENLLNNKEDDINKLLLEKQIQQQISEASLRLANDSGQPKSVRRTHKQNFEMAQQKLLAINQNLSVLKKRQQQQKEQQQQQQKEQRQQLQQQGQHLNDHKLTARDDIDLHKTAQANRFRSNSNSSSMLIHLSERRNSVKSNTSSNASGSIVGHHLLQHQHHQQQMLQVQIPGGHYHLSQQQVNHQSQQISPYSIHSGIIPSGSQSMTSAASAAMISQLSMLRQRARTDSFPGIANSYESVSAGSGTTEPNLKISPLSGSGSIASGGSANHQQSSTVSHHHVHHHHHQMGPGPARMNRLIQQQIGVNYSPPLASGSSTTTGYVLSPTAIGASPSGSIGGQAFVYDAKVISRLQGGGNVNNNPRSPQVPSSSYGPSFNDQNHCPNTMLGRSQNGTVVTGHDYGDQDISIASVPAGLGGYWMTLESGEKIWCPVDNRQFSSLDRKSQSGGAGGSMKLSRTSTKLSGNSGKSSSYFATAGPTVKSSSLGNFQEHIGKPMSQDDNESMTSVQPDAISVTSGSSEHKKREKVWRETSLDSPIVKQKALPPVPSTDQMSPSSIGSGHLIISPQTPITVQTPPYVSTTMNYPPTTPLHINTNVSGYSGQYSPLLLSPQHMRYCEQRQQQIIEQQRQRIKQQQRSMTEEQLKQQFQCSRQNEPISSASSKQLILSSIGATTTTTDAYYNGYSHQQLPQEQQILPHYHSRHQQHPPPPPLPPQNQHHYQHSLHHQQQQHQSRLQHPPSSPPQQVDLLSHSYTHHHRLSQLHQHHQQPRQDAGYYPHALHLSSTLSSRHPDLVISPTLSQTSSHTLTSPSSTTVVQALPVVGGLEDNGIAEASSPSSSSKAPPSDILMESPKNMTVVQQGKIMPYKEVTKPFEMSDFYKYSTKYRQKQQQQLQQPSPSEVSSPENHDCEANGSSTMGPQAGDGIHKGVYQPPNRSICQPIVNNYN